VVITLDGVADNVRIGRRELFSLRARAYADDGS
jgi:hypothetical protein